MEGHLGVGIVMTTRVGLSIPFDPGKCQRGLCVDVGSIGDDTGKTSASAYDAPIPTSLGI
jgi:hypothetical protein